MEGVVDFDMVVDADLRLFPFPEDVWMRRQRAQCGPLLRFEQVTVAVFPLQEGLAIELHQERGDLPVQFFDAEELDLSLIHI